MSLTNFAFDELAVRNLGLGERIQKPYNTEDAVWVDANAIDQEADRIARRPIGKPSEIPDGGSIQG